MFTTRPGTSSPIQDSFFLKHSSSYLQFTCEKKTRNNDDPRVSNIVKFSDIIGELKVEAVASIKDENSVAQGTTFVLQKETVPRQRLLATISQNKGVA
ncbi:unnamed protein product [Cochlearia groenlandica]